MENQTKTKLPFLLHRELLLGGVRIHARLQKSGFIMLGSRSIDYGFQIRFIFNKDRGCFRIYKKNKNRTTFDYSGINHLSTIQEIKKIADFNKFLFTGTFKETIPTTLKRERMSDWYKQYLASLKPDKGSELRPVGGDPNPYNNSIPF
jgi:hypothetical protein